MTTRTLGTNSSKRLVQLLGLAVLLFGLFGRAGESEARLDPFFVLRAQSFARFQPRILFVLDTSGSMTNKPSLPDQGCNWAECEQPGAGHSRIYAARKAVRSVIAQTSDQASFALMSFGHVKAPQTIAQIPSKCVHPAFNQPSGNRFTWVTTNSAPNSGWVFDGNAWNYQWSWSPILNVFGTQGTWMLCGDNRPFPYLRYNDLGGFNMPKTSNSALTEEPLYKSQSNLNAFQNGANYNRKVQWFTRYVGRRVNFNCADPLQSAIVQASRGDWGTTVNTKNTNLCGADLYYWPYVDGFPGYSYNWAQGPYTSTETECYDNATCYTGADNWYQPGVARRDATYAASLWSPFYSQAAIANAAIPAAEKGPRTQADATATMDGLVSDMYAGGIDASDSTPWHGAVGNVDIYASIGNDQQIIPTNSFNNTNAAFQHYTVASYLVFMQSLGGADLCRPTAVVYITDGQPDPWADEGGPNLYSRLSKIRRKLGVKSYVVGFSQGFANDPVAWDRLQGMACAAGGSTNYNGHPCDYDNDAYDWDTCADKTDPQQGCAWMADDATTLSDALVQIIAGVIRNDVPGGPGMAASEFATNPDPDEDPLAVQTFLTSTTDTAGLKGHVRRSACDTDDPENPGQLAPWCANAALLPLDTEEEESFGPCPIGRVWDAGECLALTEWNERRIYSHDANKTIFRITDSDGDASAQFEAVVKSLNSQGKLSPPLSNNVATQNAEIQALAEFVLGKDMPDEWKLAGVPNSSPILVRRIPKANEGFMPTVGIRDPHCAGRRSNGENDVPTSLKTFANNSWNMTQGGGLGSHYEYTEAVLVGDDLGLMHAFHYDSGNELFAVLPMDLISHARQLSLNGNSNFGQSNDIDEHVYGAAATANVGWAYDHASQTWRHLASWGFGPGGNELLVFDVSHMGRLAQDDPVDLLWTTELASIKADYDDGLGETWSRPALTYMVPGDSILNEPYAFFVFGSGYRHGQGPVHRGRTVWLVDAMTGETYHDEAFFQAPPDQLYFDTPDDFAAINDPAVSTHCLSGFWAEMQEAYIADPAGRLFRWDIAPETNNPYSFPQIATSGGKWAAGGNGLSVAQELFRFPACEGAGDFACTVQDVKQNGNRGDLFVFSPAAAANNKIDPDNADGGVLSEGERDQFLIAMISGSPNDNATDGGDPANVFHSSLYLITDDHRPPNSEAGVNIPGFGGITPPGTNANFMRLPLSDISRTRTITFPDGSTEIETREFSKAAKPLRSPLVKVTGAANGAVVLDVEVYYITFTVYEPGEQTCDSRWFDKDTEQWEYDYGDTYEITFRLAVEGGQAFNFLSNYAMTDYGDGFGASGNLSGPVVEQIGDGGIVQKAPSNAPCDPNASGSGELNGPTAVQIGWSELQGFSPLEIGL